MHPLSISTFETVPQFYDNLKIQFNEGKEYRSIRTVNTFWEYEKQR